MKHRIFAALTAGLLLCGILTGCGGKQETSTTQQTAAPAAQNGEAQAEGEAQTGELPENTFIITLYPDKAPITCENFENLVQEGFYDGLNFHRIVEGFMAQGGDGTDAGKEAASIKGEFAANGVQNDLSHTRGVVSMARTQVMDSASSQFFICYSDSCTFLDGNYAAFGKVTEGMEVVDQFLEVPRAMGMDGDMSAPTSPVTMKSVVMIEDDADGNPRVQVTMDDFMAGVKTE